MFYLCRSQKSCLTQGRSRGNGVSIWKVGGGWQHIKLLSGHSAAVNDITTHPTGAIALSAPPDKHMHLWGLCTGSSASGTTARSCLVVHVELYVIYAVPDLISCAGSVTGPVSIWKVGGGWQHIKLLSGHSATVNDIATHPSGVIALSASRDKQMRLWDLCKGSCAYQAALGAEGDLVSFLPGGEHFLIGTGTTVTLHSTKVSSSPRPVKHDTVASQNITTSVWDEQRPLRDLLSGRPGGGGISGVVLAGGEQLRYCSLELAPLSVSTPPRCALFPGLWCTTLSVSHLWGENQMCVRGRCEGSCAL
jgi:WD40 repeat protein